MLKEGWPYSTEAFLAKHPDGFSAVIDKYYLERASLNQHPCYEVVAVEILGQFLRHFAAMPAQV